MGIETTKNKVDTWKVMGSTRCVRDGRRRLNERKRLSFLLNAWETLRRSGQRKRRGLKMMFENAIVEFARSVLANSLGSGYWRTWESTKDHSTSGEICKGLKVGDKVFTYDEDEEAVICETIVVVHKGVGYYSCLIDDRPSLAYACDSHFKTEFEAARHHRQEIEADIKLLEDKVPRLAKLRDLISELDADGDQS